VDDLLAYEKISSGVLALDKTFVNVRYLVESTLAMFKIQARAKSITMLVLENEDVIQDSTYFEVDSGKMCQVLRNFISNALKFTPENGAVRIEATEQDGFVTIRVIDSGVGIEAKNLPKVFQEIVQFDVNKNQKGGGSGMGLWLSKQIVELHGGSVAVTSEGDGKGCCFEVRLKAGIPTNIRSSIVVPIHSGNPDVARVMQHRFSLTVDPSPSSPVPNPAAPASLMRQCLVVDDSKLNRKVMTRLLGLLDCATEEAGDGVQCVSMIKESLDRFAVVFIDHEMPLLNGPQAVVQLRELGYRGAVVGVTGNAVAEEMKTFTDSGADEVLIKPVTLEQLAECLRKHSILPWELREVSIFA
jgi:CheY-like chemotaxis protein/anti-sigma regulatory factor (Ser/Thr protein kinase)